MKALLLAALLAATPAAAQETLRPDDALRLAALDDHAGAALREALAGGAPADVAVLTEALAGPTLPVEAAQPLLAGEWSCRMLKLGKLTPLLAYPAFRCRIGADGSLEKLTGSQRSRGRIFVQDGRLIYAGTGYVAGDTPPAYAELPEVTDPSATPQVVPEVGLVEVTGAGAARILLPAPMLESRLNILVLRRD